LLHLIYNEEFGQKFYIDFVDFSGNFGCFYFISAAI